MLNLTTTMNYRPSFVHPFMPVIPLVPSDSPTLISSLLPLSAHHLALPASAWQPLKSGTLSLHLSVPVPVLIPSVVTSRPTTASRPSNQLNPSLLAPQIRLCWPLCAFINILLTYLLITRWRRTPAGIDMERNYVTVTLCIARGYVQQRHRYTHQVTTEHR